MSIEELANLYMQAKKTTIDAGYGWEIDWQADRSFEKITETAFLRETAWVILCSGMRETVVRKKFPDISAAFHNWESASIIVNDREACVSGALKSFHHLQKINAIPRVAARVLHFGSFTEYKDTLEKFGFTFLQQLPYIGPITVYHLAKNLGFPVAKPDRHLVRIAAATGYESAQALCSALASITGDSIPVVDIVLWRFATIDPKYLDFFAIVEGSQS